MSKTLGLVHVFHPVLPSMHQSHARLAVFVTDPENEIALGSLGGLSKDLIGLATTYMSRNTATIKVSAGEIGLRWGEGNMKQGMPWEDYVATTVPKEARLPKNFPVFDFFDRVKNVAISVKTLDTQTLAKLTKPNQIFSAIKKNIDAAADFKEAEFMSVKITSEMMNKIEIQLAIPVNTNKSQWVQVNRALEYGKKRGVRSWLRRLNDMSKDSRVTACADAKMNNEFIRIVTYSGYSVFQMDPKGKEHYLDVDVDDFTLGNVVLDALRHSRLVLQHSDSRDGISVHPDVTYDPDFDDFIKSADRYQDWVKMVMRGYGYKTRRAMFKEMKNCSISLSEGLMTIAPSRHQKLESWGRTKGDGIEEVMIPGGSTPEEIGAALRLAFKRCID